MAAYRWTERDWADWFEERAAIAEYHGELTRKGCRAGRARLCDERTAPADERTIEADTD